MSANAANYTSGVTGEWGKTNLISPFVTFYGIGFIKIATGTLNPITAALMAVISSVSDVAASCITKGSQRHADMNFRLAATIIIPFTVAIAFGCSFPVALTTTIIMFANRMLLHKFLSENSNE